MLTPFNIGTVTVDPPLTLAPMAGQTNHPFRILCKEYGGVGLVCTELVSSQALEQKGTRERSLELFDWSAAESPVAVQLFGCKPELMAEAACLVEERGADIVDINMGCWVPKVAKKGGGAALLRDVEKAVAVVRAVCEAVKIPVTAKVRSGWTEPEFTAVDFARGAEAEGVAAVAVHARFADQGFTGEADLSVIARVVEACREIPVIGNGDAGCGASVRRMLEQTGCHGVMIGRAALGRPWLFRDLIEELQTGRAPEPPDRAARAACAWRHAQITAATTPKPLKVAFREIRGQLSRYRLDLPGSTQVRDALVKVETLDDVHQILNPLISARLAS